MRQIALSAAGAVVALLSADAFAPPRQRLARFAVGVGMAEYDLDVGDLSLGDRSDGVGGEGMGQTRGQRGRRANPRVGNVRNEVEVAFEERQRLQDRYEGAGVDIITLKAKKEALAEIERERLVKLERDDIAEKKAIARLERERLIKFEREAKAEKQAAARLEKEALAKLEREAISEKKALAKLEAEAARRTKRGGEDGAQRLRRGRESQLIEQLESEVQAESSELDTLRQQIERAGSDMEASMERLAGEEARQGLVDLVAPLAGPLGLVAALAGVRATLVQREGVGAQKGRKGGSLGYTNTALSKAKKKKAPRTKNAERKSKTPTSFNNLEKKETAGRTTPAVQAAKVAASAAVDNFNNLGKNIAGLATPAKPVAKDVASNLGNSLEGVASGQLVSFAHTFAVFFLCLYQIGVYTLSHPIYPIPPIPRMYD